MADRRSIRRQHSKWRAMTLKEAAASLGTTPDNLRGAIARGALKADKMGRDWFVTPREVERYRKDNLRGPRSIAP